MTDDLRTRIAAVICGMETLHAKQWSLEMADVLIRELGNLRQEPHRFQCGRDDCIRYRIISDWTPNE